MRDIEVYVKNAEDELKGCLPQLPDPEMRVKRATTYAILALAHAVAAIASAIRDKVIV